MKKFVKVGFNGEGEAAVCPSEVASIVINLLEVKKHIGACISARLFFNSDLSAHTILLKINELVTVENCYDRVMQALNFVINNHSGTRFVQVLNSDESVVFVNVDAVGKVEKIYDGKYEIHFLKLRDTLTISKTKTDIIQLIVDATSKSKI